MLKAIRFHEVLFHLQHAVTAQEPIQFILSTI